MAVHSVRMVADRRCVVLLKEPERERYFAISIGLAEAVAIAAANQPVPRPLTHDLLRTIVEQLGATVTHILVHDKKDGVYYARIVLDVQGRYAEVDSRPSDAIALAVRLQLPILVEEAILSEDAITPENEEVDDTPRVTEEDLGVFRDVIKGLDLDDLGRKS
ncbi:MAG TPA: bifunctional nuclease family protein [Chloroflexota bacterium]|nr:bifunctional nuclease family protein [Chloroflexota bacterium]